MTNSGRVYRILVVDDDEIDRRHFTTLLSRQAPETCEIEQASTGTAGLAALRAQTFDCVLLDFSLPDMTGLEFLTDAAVRGELPCAFVLITGQGNETLAVDAMKRGVQDYLPKDRVGLSSLWRAITQAVTQTELRRSLNTSMRELTSANAALEQEIVTRMATEAELRSAKDAADLANQAKTRFVAMITHELRTPLNGILGYAQLLRIEGSLSERQEARVKAMMHAGQHLRDMIEGVLDFAQIESGKMELHPAAISVSRLLDDCSAFISPIAADRMLTLRIVRSQEAPRQLFADESRLRQVLLNLLGNAVKYTPSGGVELRALAATTPGHLRIEVADTGPGIKEVNRDRLFQEFERLDPTSLFEGAGLGLAIAARIIRQMNGTIGYSPNQGGGSIFWLELPATDVAEPWLSRTAESAPVQSGRSLLLVEDIALNRDVISSLLRAAGHHVTLAENGREALALVSESKFDLILMDIRMPEMDGLEATRRIRALSGARGQIPILALTAQSFPEQLAECRNAGMDRHVVKPVDHETLIRTIAELTTQAQSHANEQEPAFCPPVVSAQRYQTFNQGTFAEVRGYLPPDAVRGHLQTLYSKITYMLRLIEDPDEAPLLLDTAHGLASTAGMFGFEALSHVSRDFERAIAGKAPNKDDLTRVVRSEIQSAMTTLSELFIEHRMQSS